MPTTLRDEPDAAEPTPSVVVTSRPAAGIGTLLGLLATASLVAAGALRVVGDARIAVGPIAGLLVLASLPLFARRARSSAPARPGVLLGLTATAIALVLGCGALWALEMPLVSSGTRCGTGDLGFVVIVPAMFVGAGALGASIASAALARWSRGVDLTVRTTAWCAIAACALLALAATRAAATMPDPDRYVASLPVVAHVVPASATARAVVALEPGLTLESGRGAHGEPEVVFRAAGRAPVRFAQALGTRSDAPSIAVRADAGRFYVLTNDGEGQLPWGAYSVRDNRRTDVFASRAMWLGVAPPRGWIAGAWVGVLIALGVLATGARRRSRLLARQSAWQAGVLGVDGWITFRDGAAPRRAPDASVAPGPVVVVSVNGAAPPATFRSDGGLGELEVFAGTPDELAAHERAGGTGRHAVALAAVALLGASLFATVLPLLGWGR